MYQNNFDSGGHYPLVNYVKNCENHLDFLCDKSKKSIKYNIFFDSFIRNSFLRNNKTPFVLLMDNYEFTIKCISSNNAVLSENAIKYFNENGIEFYLSEHINNIVHYDKDTRLGILWWLNHFSQKNNLSNVRVFTCEANVKHLNTEYRFINIRCKNIFLNVVAHHINNITSYETEKTSEHIEKKFWCGNAEYTDFRHATILFLLNRSGNYSWLNGKNKISEDSLIEEIKTHNEQLYQTLKNNNDQLKFMKMDKSSCSVNSRLKTVMPFYKKCFCAIVTETLFKESCSDLSEKTLYSIAYLTPFVLVGNYKSLKYLKDLGFKTFSEFWDESYDDEPNPVKRMCKIYSVIEYIDSFEIEDLRRIYHDMRHILTHNSNVLKTLSNNKTVLD